MWHTNFLRRHSKSVLAHFDGGDLSRSIRFLPIRYILDNLFLTHETIDFARSLGQTLTFSQVKFSQSL